MVVGSLLIFYLGFQLASTESLLTDTILCRNCGIYVSKPSSLINKLSSESLHTYNETLFSNNDVVVQILPKDIFQIPVIISTNTSCLGVGEWIEKESWFTNYHWKPCVCPECGVHLGYRFPVEISQQLAITMATDKQLDDQEFLSRMEEELKDRYTEKDEDFMEVYNLEPPMPPIIENWYTSNNSGRRNNRQYHPYDRQNRDRDGGYRRDGERGQGSHSSYNNYRRGYNDYEDDRQGGRYNRYRY